MTNIETKKEVVSNIVLDTNYALVTYYPSLRIGKVEWLAKANSTEYQGAIITLMDYAEKHPVHYYLSDITKQSVVSPEDRKWFENIMIPMAIGKGLKKAGVIFAGNVFKKYYVNMILQVTNKLGLPLKLFSTEAEAIKWFLKD